MKTPAEFKEYRTAYVEKRVALALARIEMVLGEAWSPEHNDPVSIVLVNEGADVFERLFEALHEKGWHSELDPLVTSNNHRQIIVWAEENGKEMKAE